MTDIHADEDDNVTKYGFPKFSKLSKPLQIFIMGLLVGSLFIGIVLVVYGIQQILG